MSAFEECSKVEARGLRDITEYLDKSALYKRYVLTQKGEHAQDVQKKDGDIMANDWDEVLVTIEVKVEQTEKWKNLFLETYSNKSRDTAGWFFTIKSELLFYYFLDSKMLYQFYMADLHRWALGGVGLFPNHPRKLPPSAPLLEWREREQKKWEQPNDTWGRPVNIKHLLRNVTRAIGQDVQKVLDEVTSPVVLTSCAGEQMDISEIERPLAVQQFDMLAGIHVPQRQPLEKA